MMYLYFQSEYRTVYDTLRLYHEGINIYQNFILPNQKDHKTDNLAKREPDLISSNVPNRSVPTPEDTSNVYANHGNIDANVYANGGIPPIAFDDE